MTDEEYQTFINEIKADANKNLESFRLIVKEEMEKVFNFAIDNLVVIKRVRKK